MSQRIKSAFLRRTNSIKRSSFNGIKDTILTHRPHIGDNVTYASNEYIHKRFFDDDNYQSIIECLDDGYKISMNFIEYMQDYCNLQQQHAHSLTSYSDKWKSKLKQQSSLSSYNTTKRAQLQTVRSPDKLAQLIQTRCEAMEQVITAYRQQVERMYLSERLGTVHKHYRSDSMKKAFKSARSALSKLSDTLEKLHEEENEARVALHNADVQYQNFSLDPTTSKNKLSRAKDTQEKRQYELDDVNEKIARAEKDQTREQENYLEKATEIYYQCRELEKERLDQIRETLIKFCQAAHTSEYSTGQDTIFDELIETIKTQQDSTEDLDFWARTYHVDITTKSISSEATDNIDSQETTTTTTQESKTSQKNETENLPTIEENKQQLVIEDNEEQSSTNANSSSAKTKVKKTKIPTAIEKKTSSTTEPSTKSN